MTGSDLPTRAAEGSPFNRTYGTAEAAIRLELTRQRLRDLARAGKVACQLVPRGKRTEYWFDADGIDRLAEERRVSGGRRQRRQATDNPALATRQLRSEVASLQAELVREQLGRAIAEAKIDVLHRMLARQAKAIQALSVDPLSTDLSTHSA